MNRHFHMICIRDKFSQNIGRQVPSKVIWDHLSTMYDMQALVSWAPAPRRPRRASWACPREDPALNEAPPSALQKDTWRGRLPPVQNPCGG